MRLTIHSRQVKLLNTYTYKIYIYVCIWITKILKQVLVFLKKKKYRCYAIFFKQIFFTNSPW